MRYFLKSYKSLTSQGYRIVMLLILPALFLGAAVFCGTQKELLKFIMAPFLIMDLALADFFSDIMFFGGICNKNIRGIGLVQTSFDGMHVLRNAMILDSMRRGILVIGGSVVVAACAENKAYVLFGVIGYLGVTLLLNVSRYVSEAMFQVVFSGVLLVIMTIAMIGVWLLWEIALEKLWLITGGVGILSIIATIGTIYHMVYRIGGSRNV